ncbi:copper amine oxidase N-terminal domain-containing protein [Syntrophomonas wolfei]|uniref:copper amine oxidase N-terminal domain-containing protein n=1 Tax=Syntrophomonas wolfei TaxID=863 RepID=UPI0002D75444|nr:copper amine oxidase N-terminal domain-containing protein [Syntrophomonas wolfei]
MLKRRSKHFALLLVLTMLATMFVGVGTASAGASYSVGSVVKVNAGAAQDLGKIIVNVTASELNTTSVDFFTLRLPADFDFGLTVGNDYTLTQIANTDTFGVNGAASTLQIRIPTQANAFSASNSFGNAGITVDVIAKNEIKIKVASDGTQNASLANAVVSDEKTGYFYIQMTSVFVDSSSPSTIEATIEGRAGSPFGDAKIAIAQYGTGITNLTIDSVKTITSAATACDIIRLKEDRPGAFRAGDTIEIKLPSGYKWDTLPTITKSDGPSVYTVPTASTADDGRTLVLTSNQTSNVVTYLLLSGQRVKVDDESIAKFGDVEATVGGTASSAPGSFLVVKYGDYSVKAEAFGDPLTVTAGRVEQEIGKFVIEEGIKESLLGGRTINATLVGGAKWGDLSKIRQDTSNSKNWMAPMNASWAAVGNNGDTIKLTLTANTASTDAIKAVFEKAEIIVSPTAEEEIKIVFSGSANVTGEAVVAKVVKPVTVGIEGTPAQFITGKRSLVLPDIVITESKKEAIDAASTTSTNTNGYTKHTVGATDYYFIDLNGNGTYDPATERLVPAKDALTSTTTANNWLFLEFPVGTACTVPTKVEVVEGDLVLDPSSVSRSVTADGRWYVQVKIKSTSSKPSKVKFSGIKLDVDRTVPEGDVKVYVKGGAVLQTTAAFPGATSIANAVVAQIITPADTVTTSEAKFVIGDSKYTLNGIEKTMDVAPYIKDSRTYMPLRFVAEAMGVTESNIIWDAVGQTVTLMKGDKVVQVKIGSNVLLINGAAVNMDVAPEISNSRTMLPIRFVANAFGADAAWDEATQTVTIK